MRRALILGPLLAASLVLFVAAGLAGSDSTALLLATAGALLPALGLLIVSMANAWRWRHMGRALGLVPTQAGMFPDMEGRLHGRRLLISRRTNPYGMGPRLNTLVRLEGMPQVLLPGLVVDEETVQGILEPLVEPEKQRE